MKHYRGCVDNDSDSDNDDDDDDYSEESDDEERREEEEEAGCGDSDSDIDSNRQGANDDDPDCGHENDYNDDINGLRALVKSALGTEAWLRLKNGLIDLYLSSSRPPATSVSTTTASPAVAATTTTASASNPEATAGADAATRARAENSLSSLEGPNITWGEVSNHFRYLDKPSSFSTLNALSIPASSFFAGYQQLH
jgi:hypothetical protein